MNSIIAQAVPAAAAVKDYYSQATSWLAENGMTFGRNLVVAVLILIVGRIIAGAMKGMITRLLDARKVDATLSRFLANICSSVLMILILIAALGQLGIPTTQFTALIAAAGIAIGAALSGNISNFASGFMIIFFRPIKKGDYIAVAGTEGIVDEVQIFHTILNTMDNKLTIVANSKITGDVLTNFSGNALRRADINVIVGPQNDPAKVRQLLLGVAAANPLVVKSPATEAVIKDINGKLHFELRAWCAHAAYWDTFFQLTESAHVELTRAKIEPPPVIVQVIQK